MNRAIAMAPALLLVLPLAGCDRERAGADKLSTTITITQELPPGAERKIEQVGAVLDDAAVTAKVKAALVREPELSALAIDVDTVRNVVTLRGTVASTDESKRAEQAARAVEGVKQVHNKLAVRQS